MDNRPPDRDEEQLNKAQPESAPQDFSLDEIIDEFGGWTKRLPVPVEPPEPAPAEQAEPQPQPDEPEEDAKAWQPEPPAPSETADSELEPEPSDPQQQGDTIRFAPIRGEEHQPEQPEEHAVWVYKGEPMPEGADAQEADARERKQAEKRQRQLERFRKREARRKNRKKEQPEHAFSSLEEAARFYSRTGSIRLRMAAAVFAAAVSLALLVLGTPGLIPNSPLSSRACAAGILILLVVQMLLCADVCLTGALRAIRLRYDHIGMLTLSAALCVLDALGAVRSGRMPFGTVPTVLLLLALRSQALLYEARRKSLRAVSNMAEPVAVVREAKAWHGYDCLFRTAGDGEAFARQLEMPDAVQRVMRVYAPVMTILTLVIAALSSARYRSEFLPLWTAMMLVSYPAGLILGYAQPFASASKRLYRAGAAVAGWQGARVLSGEAGLIVEDADLFPPQNVTQGGMKIYVERTVPQIIGYAAAVVRTAGSGLQPLFEEMMHDQNGRRYTVDTFRRYEGGGLGAEIGGDVVLMGSLAFMKLMKVRVPEGTRLRQAVYLSINSELAAVFALNYAAAEKIKTCLVSVLRSGSLVPVLATRDFMITPQFLKLRYQVPPEYIEFPTVEERARLSTPGRAHTGPQGALLARASFVSFTEAVVTARRMRKTARRAMAIAIAGGLLGAASVAFLALLGANQSVTGWNLLLYTALWMVPSVLVMLFGMWM